MSIPSVSPSFTYAGFFCIIFLADMGPRQSRWCQQLISTSHGIKADRAYSWCITSWELAESIKGIMGVGVTHFILRFHFGDEIRNMRTFMDNVVKLL